MQNWQKLIWISPKWYIHNITSCIACLAYKIDHKMILLPLHVVCTCLLNNIQLLSFHEVLCGFIDFWKKKKKDIHSA